MSRPDDELSARTPQRSRASRLFWPALVLIAVVGLFARCWNLDFDQRQHLHPDERHWSLTSAEIARSPRPAEHGTIAGPLLDWLDGDRSPANGYRGSASFVYGPLPLAAARGASGWLRNGVVDGDQPAAAVARLLDAVGIPLIDDEGNPRFDDAYEVDLVGRLLGALTDTMTIVVVGLIGRRLAGPIVGVVAGALYATSVLAIQHAHFLGSEPLLGLGCALTLWLALRIDRSASVARGAWTAGLVGLAAGLAMAAKLSAVGLVAVPFAGCLALVVLHRRRSDLVRLAALAVGAALSFRVLYPGAFRGLGVGLSPSFTDDVRLARSLAHSTLPPSFQWSKRLPVLQPLLWLGIFTVGPGVTIAAIAGAWTMCTRRWRAAEGVARWSVVILLAGIVAPFAYIELTSLPAGRYYMPMLPALHVVAGLGVVALLRSARAALGRRRALGYAAATASVGLALLWAIAFVNGVYGGTHTRIEASHWIEENVPPGSVLTSQAWDDGLPLRLPGLDTEAFTSEQLDMVGPDEVAKVERIADQLVRVDYVIESSPRIWATVTRLPARFPSTINFFSALDSGELGFERVATFTARPGIGPWELDDSRADEAFSVYDHPEVRIWEKTRTLERDEIVEILDPVAASTAVPVVPEHGWANGLMLFPDELATNAAGGSYDDAFDTASPRAWHVVGWFLLLEVFGLAAFVIFQPLLRRLPDAGLGISKTLALAATSMAVFVGATWLDLTITRRSVAAVVVVFLGVAATVGWRTRRELLRLWHERRGMLVAAECVGAVLFVAFVLLRSANPDLWHQDRGGEKPFELALLTAVLRTRTLPVYDPWFSGGVLNYHYGGWFLLTAPARLLRTTPSLVMNIALGVFASCAGGAAFSLGSAVVAGRVRRWRTASRRWRDALAAGVLASGAVLVLSSAAIVRPLWRWLTGTADGVIDWWALSRVIPASVAITEFPAWSLLYGDIHPHVMGIAVLLTLCVCCLACFWALVDGRRGAGVALAAIVGVLVGFVRMTNTWDLPLAYGLVAVTLVAAAARRVPWRLLLAAALTIAGTVIVVWWPYTARGEVYDSGVERATLYTPLTSWLEHFGFFVVVTAFVAALHLRQALRESEPRVGRVTDAHLVLVALVLVGFGLATVWPDQAVAFASGSLAAASLWTAHRRRRADGRTGSALGALVLTTGWLILVGVELFTIRNDGGRQNTVFKFWYQSWILLAVGAAVVLAEQARLHRLSWRRGSRATRVWPRRASRVILLCGAVLAAGFWWLTTPIRLDDRISAGGLMLDGEAYLRPEFAIGADDDRFVPADDVELIRWIRANVDGIGVVAEAPGDDYRWTSRISSLTGLPTPIGWPYHESQQRRAYGPAIDQRRADLGELYSTTDPEVMSRVLERYDVAVVVFGTQERRLATPESAKVLRGLVCLDVGYEGQGLTEGLFVATVDQQCLSRRRTSG